MGKRRRNEKQGLACALGIPRVHYCRDHNEKVKAFRLWPSKSMRFQCKEGCDLNKNETVLKQQEVKKKR
jgi:hypothetical protein